MRPLGLLLALTLTACTSITQIGTVGPKALPVFSIRDTGFLSEGRMLVILTPEGEIGASTGGVTPGPGPVVAGFIGQVAVGAGVAYAGQALARSLAGIRVDVKGQIVPGSVHVVPGGPILLQQAK